MSPGEKLNGNLYRGTHVLSVCQQSMKNHFFPFIGLSSSSVFPLTTSTTFRIVGMQRYTEHMDTVIPSGVSYWTEVYLIIQTPAWDSKEAHKNHDVRTLVFEFLEMLTD